MRDRSRLLACVAVLSSSALVPATATGQCAFDRATGGGSSTGVLQVRLAPAYRGCGTPGDPAPNTTAMNAAPACQPPERWSELAGNPAHGWRFVQLPRKSWGKLAIKTTAGGPNLPGYPPTVRDLSIRLKLKHLVQNDGLPAQGTGKLFLLLRATIDDYASGDVTVADIPVNVDVPAIDGTASVTAVLGDALMTAGQPRLPDCSTIEIVAIAVRDPAGDTFAVPGLRL